MLVSDGDSDEPGRTLNASAALKDIGVLVVAVCIGAPGSVACEEMGAIATGPRYLFQVHLAPNPCAAAQFVRSPRSLAPA